MASRIRDAKLVTPAGSLMVLLFEMEQPTLSIIDEFLG
jgi:hypothetical protein